MRRETLKKIYRSLPRVIVIPLVKLYGLKRWLLWPGYINDLRKFKATANKGQSRFSIDWADLTPTLGEATAGFEFDRHYIYHPAWAIRHILAQSPKYHVDISSVLAFAANLSASLPVRFYDYRPADLKLSNLYCGQADLLSLPFADNEVDSLSCMHVVEHVGLGRYGDPIDPDADLRAINELKRTLAPGGNLYFVVPIGKPKIMFNAHRIYSYDQIMQYFNGLTLKEFALVPRSDDGDLLVNPPKEIIDDQDYGCGCFWFTKD